MGKYKTGNFLLRKDMSNEEREVYTSLLDGIVSHFVSTVAKHRGKSEEEVKELLNAGIFDMNQLVEGGWVTAVSYPDEIQVWIFNSFGSSVSYPSDCFQSAVLQREMSLVFHVVHIECQDGEVEPAVSHSSITHGLVIPACVVSMHLPDTDGHCVQEDLDRRFGNEKRQKTKPPSAVQSATTAVGAALLLEQSVEKPPNKLAYVEYKKYKAGAASPPLELVKCCCRVSVIFASP